MRQGNNSEGQQLMRECAGQVGIVAGRVRSPGPAAMAIPFALNEVRRRVLYEAARKTGGAEERRAACEFARARFGLFVEQRDVLAACQAWREVCEFRNTEE